MPVSFPLSAGNTLPTALAAPVAEGMMLVAAARPPRQSLLDGPSTVFCVAVVACTVVISPCMAAPAVSCDTFPDGVLPRWYRCLRQHLAGR